VSYHGDALDEKVMLLRAGQALNDQATRLLKLLGLDAGKVSASIWLEQEFFLIPRDAYYRRPDLQLTGRTVIGAEAPRGQELCDHYMAPINDVAMACMNEMQAECFLLGIPLRTRHREVAPNQYEFAPMFGSVTTQIDQNLMVMQIIEEVASRHGLAALLQEKPFAGINGSGKHNNWSLWTDGGVNLLCPESLNAASGNPAAFPTVMASLIRAINVHGDMGRSAIASVGNDFRLGACEAPPAIVSTYLGDDMTDYLTAFMNGEPAAYEPGSKTIDLGVEAVVPFKVPAEDRNRTSPLPYGGKRFEFRAVGSAQNVSMVNTVLATTTAESMKVIADQIEGGADATQVAADTLKENFRCVFNGDNYSEEWPVEAAKRGVWRIDSGVESLARLSDPKNIKLFSDMNVLNEKECVARTTVNLEHYTGFVEMEALWCACSGRPVLPLLCDGIPGHRR
jgi:glutamine synthetase